MDPDAVWSDTELFRSGKSRLISFSDASEVALISQSRTRNRLAASVVTSSSLVRLKLDEKMDDTSVDK